jgi:GNAT superfamily N-acetyltransferase
MNVIRDCDDRDFANILEIINQAAVVYRGIIPHELMPEPYLAAGELEHEIAAGVRFMGFLAEGRLIGVMGSQRVRDADLIRHAYVLPGHQRLGVGSRLMSRLRARSGPRVLVGTWAAATWAIDFYRRQGFALVSTERAEQLLRSYWTVPEAQIAASVVLESR